MSEAAREAELESLRAQPLSAAERAEWRASARATAAWDRRHAADVDAILAWIDGLRAAFGDPPVDRRPWRGDDFRL
jgi:hypothetical protein